MPVWWGCSLPAKECTGAPHPWGTRLLWAGLQVCFRIRILQTAGLCKKAPIQVHGAKMIGCVPRAEINIAFLFFESR